MPDDRPESPEERLREAVNAAMVDRGYGFEWRGLTVPPDVLAALSTPAGPTGAEDNESFDPWGGGSPNAAAGPSPEPMGLSGDLKVCSDGLVADAFQPTPGDDATTKEGRTDG